MRIRQATSVDAVARLASKILPGDFFPYDDQHWIVWDGEHPVGFCSARHLESENTVFFSLCGLLKRARGRGLHRRMIRVRESWARKRARYAVTYTLHDNHASLANLVKAGWELYSPSRKWAGDVQYFRKDLHA